MAKEFAKAFYKSQAWQAARQQALMRDCYTCQICGGRAQEVHHIIELTPDNIRDRNISLNLNNLQSLCHDCHAAITAEEHGLKQKDCEVGYYFDSDGQLRRHMHE